MKNSRKRMAYMRAMEKSGKMPRDPEDSDHDEMPMDDESMPHFAQGGMVDDEYGPESGREEAFDPEEDTEDGEFEDEGMRRYARGGMVEYGQERGDRPGMRMEPERRIRPDPESIMRERDERRDEGIDGFRRMAKGGFAMAIKKHRGGISY